MLKHKTVTLVISEEEELFLKWLAKRDSESMEPPRRKYSVSDEIRMMFSSELALEEQLYWDEFQASITEGK